MKKKIFLMLSLTLILLSCSNEENLAIKNYKAKNLDSKALLIRKSIAPLHSEGLDYLYNYLNNPATRSALKTNKNNKSPKELILSLILD